MTGVEILNTEVIYIQEFNLAPLFILLGIGAITGFFIAGFDCGFFDLAEAICGLLVGFMLGLLLGGLLTLLTQHNTDEIDYIKYQVTVSDEVNFTEFTNKYEIIEQNGKIFTVRDRTE